MTVRDVLGVARDLGVALSAPSPATAAHRKPEVAGKASPAQPTRGPHGKAIGNAGSEPAVTPLDLGALTLEALFARSLPPGREPSPLQRALCRLADGLPLADVADEPSVVAALGKPSPEAIAALAGAPPERVCIVAGVRGGKSRLVAVAAVLGALRADLDGVSPDEEVWFAILAPRERTARATYAQVLGVLQLPELAGVVDGKPLADTVWIRRPDGRRVAIVVVAAAVGGITVRGRWLAGVVLEEAAQFGREASGAAVNAEEILEAAVTRLRPGSQAWIVSSPYGPEGLLHETWKAGFGRPTPELVVVHAPTRALNPAFPAKRIEALRARDPDTAAREYDAAWTDPETAWFPSQWVDACTRREPEARPREAGVTYRAAMDPATRGNAWTLAIAGRRWDETAGRSRVSVVLAREWIGSRKQPLDPGKVLAEIRNALAGYGLQSVETDQWSSDALRSLARGLSPALAVHERTIGADRFDLYDSLRTKLGAGELELPPDPTVRGDLLAVRRRLTSAGVAVHLPTTADGRHCDYAPAIVLATSRFLPEPKRPDQDDEDEDERMFAMAEDDDPWWAKRRKKR